MAAEYDDDYNSDNYEFDEDAPDSTATTVKPANATPPARPRLPSAGKQRPASASARREQPVGRDVDRDDRDAEVGYGYALGDTLGVSSDSDGNEYRDNHQSSRDDVRGRGREDHRYKQSRDNDNDNDRYRDRGSDRGSGSPRGRPRGRSSSRTRSRSHSRSQSPPEFFYDENGKGWVSHRERPISKSDAHSHSHQNIHETQERRPARPRPASASVRGRKPKKASGGRAAKLKKQRERARRLEQLSRPKADVDRGVSSSLSDCANCTFQPQITRYAETRGQGQRDFMSRVPGYIEGFLIKKKQQPTAHLQYSFKPKTHAKPAKTAKEKEDNLRQFLRRNEEFVRKRKNAHDKMYNSAPAKTLSREERNKRQADFEKRLESDLRMRDRMRNPKIQSTKPKKDAKTALKDQDEFYERMNRDTQERKMKIATAAQAQQFSHKPATYTKRKTAAGKAADKKVTRDSFLLRYQKDLEERDDKLQALRQAKIAQEMSTLTV